MQVRMLTLAAGPAGVWPIGTVQEVGDELAPALVAGGYAVVVGGARPPAAMPQPVMPEETTAMEPSERRVPRRPTARKAQ